MVAIYEFEVLDPARHRWNKDSAMGTLAAIEKRGAVAIKSSMMLVDSARVDGDGMLLPYVDRSRSRTG